MLKIVLIDDRDYGLKQIRALHQGDVFELDYFETFESFKKSQKQYDIAYLDYFLDKDNNGKGITGGSVVQEVKKQVKKVIGFSSFLSYSKQMQKLGADDAIEKRAS